MAEKREWGEKKRNKHKNDPHPDMAERLDKINEIWRLSRQGKTQDWIAQHMGIHQTTVSKLFREGYMLQATEDGLLGAAHKRILVLQQLEHNYQLCMDFLLAGGDETKLLLIADKILSSIRKLEGLDLPTKVQISGAEEVLESPELAAWVKKKQSESEQREAELNEGA